MIKAGELRLGNYILHKAANKISMVPCTYQHFEILAKEGDANFYPVVLKPELLEKCGFVENKEYALLPDAREFKLVLPVIGSHQNEIFAYVKNNKECFGRASVNGQSASNNIFHLHTLQNLYFALTGEELQLK